MNKYYCYQTLNDSQNLSLNCRKLKRLGQNSSHLPETNASRNSCLTILSRRDYFGQHHLHRKRQKNSQKKKNSLKIIFSWLDAKTFVRYWKHRSRSLFVWKAKLDGETHWINLKPNLQGFLLWMALSPSRKWLASYLIDFVPLGRATLLQKNSIHCFISLF